MNSKMIEQRLIENEVYRASIEKRTELNFRFRHFMKLPKSIINVNGLRKLDLFETNIEIPSWISNIDSLEELYVSETESVASLLPVIHKLHNLRVLKMSYVGGLDALPESFGQLKNLEELTLSGAEFTSFPHCIGELEKLRSLSFKHCSCDPDEVFEILSRLPNLKSLRITFVPDYEEGKDGVFDMPPSLTRLSALEVLDLHDFSELRSLPDNIHELRHLRTLNLKQEEEFGCALRRLPGGLFDIPSFEELYIVACRNINEFPKSIEHWQTPKGFHCLRSGVKVFPAFSREQMENLEHLSWTGVLPDLSCCLHLKTLSSDTGRVSVWFNHQVSGTECAYRYDFPVLTELEELVISGGILADTEFLQKVPGLKRLFLFCDFQELTEHVDCLKSLEEMHIFGARELKALPEGFSRLRSLRLLSLYACALPEIPRDLRQMEKLEFVDLVDLTGMATLSESWYSLPALKRLRIENCADMKTIPDSISQLAALESLVLRKNEKLCEISRDFGGLKNLRSLVWAGNASCSLPDFEGLDSLTSFELWHFSPEQLPDSFFRLPKLEIFDASFCNATHLPEQFASFPALKSLYLVGWNHLRFIPECIVQNSSLQEISFQQCDFSEIPHGLENPSGVESVNFFFCDKIKDALKNVPLPLAEKLNRYA